MTFKQKAAKAAVKAMDFGKRCKKKALALAVTSSMMMTAALPAFAAGEAVSGVDFSSVDFSPITSTISSAIPTVMPLVVGLVGIRKGISFVMGMVRGA